MICSTKTGFTLIELMIAVALIACLSMLAVPNLMKVLAKAKRTEAYLYLRTIAQAQKIYFAEHGRYTSILHGKGGLGWKPEGHHIYTYGFPGTTEGSGHFLGSLKTPVSSLSAGQIGQSSFTVVAAGNIYGDEIDILTINERGDITLVHDALQ
jgi:prepilin-type N-terminal cleavage/methylation domain-containing protein